MARSRVGRGTRQLLVFAHVAISLGWIGAGAANVVLAMTAGYTASPEVRRVCYYMIERVDDVLVIPGAAGALISGLVLCAVTPWGFAKYWWVLTKLAVTVAVIVYSTVGVGVWVEQSVVATAAADVESPVAGPLAYGVLLNIAAFLFMTWASVAKPWGSTPWTIGRGRRPRRQPRSAAATA